MEREREAVRRSKISGKDIGNFKKKNKERESERENCAFVCDTVMPAH